MMRKSPFEIKGEVVANLKITELLDNYFRSFFLS
jgi:hypothetical protein